MSEFRPDPVSFSTSASGAGPDVPPPMLLSGLEPVVIGEDALFVNIGERTNVTGSQAFERMFQAGGIDQALSLAR